MNAGKETTYTSAVSHSDKKYHKKLRKIYYNSKSLTAMFLSATLLLTSVDCMKVQAEELAVQLPPAVTEEETETEETVSGNTLPEGEETAEPDYVRTESGAIIIDSFVPLPEEDSQLVVEERLSLEEVTNLMPKVLSANVKEYVATDPGTGSGEQPGGGTEDGQQPEGGAGDAQQPAEGEQPGGGTEDGAGDAQQPAEGEQPEGGTEDGAGDAQQPAEGEQPGGGTEDGQQPEGGAGDAQQPAEGEQPGGGTEDEQQPEGGAGDAQQPAEEEQPAVEQEESGAEEDRSEAGQEEAGANDIARIKPDRTLAAAEGGHQWRMLVAAEVDADGAGESADGEAEVDENGSGGTEGGEAEANAGTGDDTNSGGHAGDDENGSGADAGGSTDVNTTGSGEAGGTEEGGSAGGHTGSGESDSTSGNGNADGSTGGGEDGGTGETGNTDDNTGSGVTDGAGENGSVGGSADNGGNGESESGDGGTGGLENGGGTGDGGSVSDNTTGGEAGENDSETELPGEDLDNLKATSELVAEVSVTTWSCKDKEYDPDKADIYTFVPEWEETKWFFEESGEHTIPTIEVAYRVSASAVSTEEELAAAFAAGFKKITLKSDIALTKPLVLPVDANIELDGSGDGGNYKLTRGNVAAEEGGSSSVFLGTMIDMNGEGYTRDKYGRLRLTNITVDGTAAGNRAAAPVIVDYGRLTLGEGAKVTGNYNYGTPGEAVTGKGRIPEYGGGICVYRELILEAKGEQPQPSVTGNYADLLGGGVYLGEGAELWLYGDVVKDNTVAAANGKGPDLYAAPYSKIHYNAAAFPDIENWPTFFLSKGVFLLPIGEGQEIPEPAVGHNKEIYISVSKGSGYSEKELLELKRALGALGYTVISNQRTEIDTTDLRNWDVYDHYDTVLWACDASPSAAWSKAYEGYRKRPYYRCTETNPYYNQPNPPATTIEKWLEYLEQGKYMDGGTPRLARFKEHIVSREEGGRTAMTFAGYGVDPYIDFLFIDPYSSGEKVVSFDVDSSRVYTHTLAGNGFLINTGEKDGVISGYLVYYTYLGSGANARANKICLYRLNDGLTIDDLHRGIKGTYSHNIGEYAQLKEQKVIEAADWKPNMSIKIKVTPGQVRVWQQPKSDMEIDETKEAFVTWKLDDTGYNGYGPLVVYQKHNCSEASSFTYSNLYMYFTDPTEESEDMMSSLAEADYSQDDTQKYFVNLFGNDKLEYGKEEFRNYQGYLKMMQEEGIALITDREAPFEEYLGSANDPKDDKDPENLLELDGGRPGNKLSIVDLVKQIDGYMNDRTSTSLKETVEAGGLQPAQPDESTGNIWLKSLDDGKQIRNTLKKDNFDGKGYGIQIMDDITYYYDKGNCSVTYEIQKPGESKFTKLNVEDPPVFWIAEDWPEGPYTVRQTITEGDKACTIKGYAYFNLDWPPTHEVPSTYPVAVKVKVQKDGAEWNGHGRKFVLRPEAGEDLGEPFGPVPAGTYAVYDVTESAEGVYTGQSITLENAAVSGTEQEVTVDYYTVTFYEEYCENEEDLRSCESGEEPNPQVVLENQCASRPGFKPEKDKHAFAGWVNADGTDFDFDNKKIGGPARIYAKWEEVKEPRYQVTIDVRKDGENWNDSGRIFALQPESGEEETVFDLGQVKRGVYRIYDITGEAPASYRSREAAADVAVNVADGDTGVTLTVEEDTAAVVDYYTVTFYDGETAYPDDGPQAKQIVLKGKTISPPADPSRQSYTFKGWVTEDKGSAAYDFTAAINNTTVIYAGWKYPVIVRMTVRKDNQEWNDHGRHFMLWQEGGAGLTEISGTVSTGTYVVYDVTESAEGVDTGLSLKLENVDTPDTVVEVTVDYYTVTFYDENSADKKLCNSGEEPNPQIVLKDQCAGRPAFKPAKDKHAFDGWVTAAGTDFDFTSKINKPTEIYAKWEEIKEPRYKVTVNARKDQGGWNDSGRIFALQPEGGGGENVYDLEQVKEGVYRIYDVTGGNSAALRSRAAGAAVDVKVDDGDTGVTVTVEDKDETADVDYYTVTFYDGKKAYGTDTPQHPMVVLKGKRAVKPSAPGKSGYRFTGWKTSEGGGTDFSFNRAISSKTDIYAGWRAVPGAGRKSGEKETPGGGGSVEDVQTITVVQESPQPGEPEKEGEPREPKTGDMPIPALPASLGAGTAFMVKIRLWLYELETGISEEKKNEILRSLVGWAKGRAMIRVYLAIAATAVVLTAYHFLRALDAKRRQVVTWFAR